MLTLGGAQVLGLETEIGTLEVGKWADLCLLRLERMPVEASEGAASILQAATADVMGTWIGGRRVYGTT
jgi:cytosine/adenosine deaminase-related metal-dependent hydrolase